MINTIAGNIGHLAVILSFVTAAISAFFFSKGTGDSIEGHSWARLGRILFIVHSAAILLVVGTLYYVIANHLFEYHYAWSHSSRALPAYYMISAFWEGQEGSFLLWLFWNAVLGLVLIYANRYWQAPVMAVVALVQAFLASMILGVVLFNIKIGSSPFILLRDAMQNAPVFQINPDFVPPDGTGLNPLLQNYWMVIHPPTLFLGFASTLIPFAYAIAGLWKKRVKEWIRPALPWALFSAMVLGVGILMGGYWAYETLSFGGYWSWDPVENAVYVPWVILVASVHTMITYKQSQTALKSSIILSIATFVLILYSTFLTRSGILGNASVHSFTDLGLSGQLLIYLLAFAIGAIALAVYRWKHIPKDNKEVSVYSREFWIFIGATTLCLAGFQVIVTTSIPVYNSIVESFGRVSNIAPPTDPVSHYNKFQIWFAVAVAVLSGMGQFFFWKKIDRRDLLNTLQAPVIVALLLTSLLIFVSRQLMPEQAFTPTYIALITASLFTIIANAFILKGLLKTSPKLSGGAVAHIGIGLMLLGILYSSGFSKVISLNNSGLLISTELSEEVNRENLLLWRNKAVNMGRYTLRYKGPNLEVAGIPGYVPMRFIQKTADPYRAILKEDVQITGKLYGQQGDTVKVDPVNIYYQVLYSEANGKEFSLYPRAQINPDMGGLLASPDIKRFPAKDMYTHVSIALDPAAEKKWTKPELYQVQVGDTFFLNDYVAVLQDVNQLKRPEGIELGPEDAAVAGHIQVFDDEEVHLLHPVFVIKDRMVGKVPDKSDELGIRVFLEEIDPETRTFTLKADTTQKDFIILKAIEKPGINILWIGTLVLVIGFVMAISRRYSEFLRMKEKGLE